MPCSPMAQRPCCAAVYGASWSARVHEEVATIEDAGVERLTIRFP